MKGGRVSLLLLLSAMLFFLASAGVCLAAAQRACTSCHDEARFGKEFARSVHGRTGCLSCHKISDMDRHARGEEEPALISCGTCHAEQSRAYSSDVHYIQLDFRCYDCHRDIHAIQRSDKSKAGTVRKCAECHTPADYVAKGHGAAVLRGNNDSASCADCHGLHGIAAFSLNPLKPAPEARAFYTAKCVGCHADPELTRRNGMSPETVRQYEETYHGKVLAVGYPERVAGCADCHISHNILPPDNPESVLSPQNRAAMCGRCHSGFHPRFASYIAHPDHKDPDKYPVLYVTSIFMIVLIVGVFVFFWTHTVLWWRKSYSEVCRQKAAGIPMVTPGQCGGEQVMRFRPLYRIMHVLLILSFFTLVMTGIPLKYHEADWARTLIRLWGGIPAAGIFHRIAASILTALFLYTVWLSMKFLFPGGRVKGWLGRLFGPDSLFPSLKDLQDIKGMFLWFFNRGEMPKLDRWTYWEKFDFLAVFWGMFAIGISGFMLWFPEEFSYVFPGWFINVAALVHSEEALLAALFIFTVHFFNNHIVPNKFPLEPNIFTGRNTVEQLRHERPLEYERLSATDALEKLMRPGPGVRENLAWRVFGLASVILGVFLTLLLIWAIVL